MTMDAVLKQVEVITEKFEKANAEIERFKGNAEDFGIDWRKDMNATKLLGSHETATPGKSKISGPQPPGKSSKESAEKALPGMSSSNS